MLRKNYLFQYYQNENKTIYKAADAENALLGLPSLTDNYQKKHTSQYHHLFDK
jgi:hypothetical protein